MTRTLTHTTTQTYAVRRFADPYKQCIQCGNWIIGVLDKPGPLVLVPCHHQSDYRDVCHSWGPVRGCRCAEVLGDRDHGVPVLEPGSTGVVL
jgi:hypothetical protein